MIDWNIADSKKQQKNWFFPSFEMQEYLLPILHVGGEHFDEYGLTRYGREGCMRLRKIIEFLTEGLTIMNKSEVRYETMHKGLVVLEKGLIIETLKNLDAAATLALQNDRSLEFYGD